MNPEEIDAIRERNERRWSIGNRSQSVTNIATLLAEVDRLAGIVDLAEGMIRSHEQRITHLAQQRDEIKALGNAMSEAIDHQHTQGDGLRVMLDAKAAWDNREATT